jgi:hypothetical protein
MSYRDERSKKCRRQGTENFPAEDILEYFDVGKFSVTKHPATSHTCFGNNAAIYFGSNFPSALPFFSGMGAL